MKKMWTKERCFEESVKYSELKDFEKQAAGAYNAAYRNGWLKDYTWLEKSYKPSGYWSKERCYEEARRYSKVKDFRKQSSVAYTKAKRNGWLKDYTWLEKCRKRNGYWSKERCYEEAIKYSSLKEFGKRSATAYRTAYINGWVDEYEWLEKGCKSKGYWSRERCFQEAGKYTTIKDFYCKSNPSYKAAHKNGWLDEYTWLERSANIYTDDVDCCYMYLNEPQKIVYVGRTINKNERRNSHKNGIGSNIKNEFEKRGLELPEPIYYMDATFPIEYGLMLEDKLVEWFKEQGWTVLNKAKTGIRSGSIGGCRSRWTKNKCYEEARKYVKLKDFIKQSANAYNAAYRNGWLKDYTWLEREKK